MALDASEFRVVSPVKARAGLMPASVFKTGETERVREPELLLAVRVEHFARRSDAAHRVGDVDQRDPRCGQSARAEGALNVLTAACSNLTES